MTNSEEKHEKHSPINVTRGLIRAAFWTMVGLVAPVVALGAYTLFGWVAYGASDFDRHYDLQWLIHRLPGPVVGCGTLCGCAGWSTHAPVGRFRFSKTLAIIFGVSVPLWFALKDSTLRLKGTNHPEFYPSEWAVLIGVPVTATVVLTVIRSCSRCKTINTKDDTTAIDVRPMNLSRPYPSGNDHDH